MGAEDQSMRGGQVHLPQFKRRLLLLLLSLIQFTITLDFLIMMPLGPQYMRVFSISPGQFGLMVSAYALSAGVAGFLAGFFLDRYDRRSALLLLYAGFSMATFLCALAPNSAALTAARAVAGIFGGVTGATILATIGDVVPEQQRGGAMGMVMSAFSVASVLGVPGGLFLANHFGWHAPFLVLAGFSGAILITIFFTFPSLRSHTHSARKHSPLAQMRQILSIENHWRALALMACMTAATFCVVPYLSPYMVKNVGLKETQLPYIYLFGGGFTIFTLNWIGRLADRIGKLRMFVVMTLSSAIPTLVVTSLGHVPLAWAISITTLFMICSSGRFVPAMALITSSVDRRYRGGFLSINSSVQNFSSGMASFFGGHLLGQNSSGALVHYSYLGMISVGLALAALALARAVRSPEPMDEASLPCL